jgi:hypothetical protein
MICLLFFKRNLLFSAQNGNYAVILTTRIEARPEIVMFFSQLMHNIGKGRHVIRISNKKPHQLGPDRPVRVLSRKRMTPG